MNMGKRNRKWRTVHYPSIEQFLSEYPDTQELIDEHLKFLKLLHLHPWVDGDYEIISYQNFTEQVVENILTAKDDRYIQQMKFRQKTIKKLLDKQRELPRRYIEDRYIYHRVATGEEFLRKHSLTGVYTLNKDLSEWKSRFFIALGEELGLFPREV
jgi:hypothetical protein